MQLSFPTNPTLIDADTAELLTSQGKHADRQIDRHMTFWLHIVDTAPLLLYGKKVQFVPLIHLCKLLSITQMCLSVTLKEYNND